MSLNFDLILPRRAFELELQGSFENATIGIFGPSGAGKTSFFNLLAGLEIPKKGKISLNGRTLTDTENRIFVPPNKRRIGVVFQEKRLFPHLNTRQNILFGERYVEEKRIAFDTVVELLDLGNLLDSIPGEMSGGEQQRTAIARALLTSPELLLLDEPFNAVDNTLRAAIFPYLRRLRDDLEIPMLVISHDLPDIQHLTNLVFLINEGKCRGFGDVMDMFGERDIFPDEIGAVNTFSVYSPKKLDDGLYECRIRNAGENTIKTPFAPGDTFSVIIPPNEIAISKEMLSNTSIQNQIPGKITRIIRRNGYVYCLIDSGVPVLSKITGYSEKRLKIKEGDSIFCFFKAHSLSL